MIKIENFLDFNYKPIAFDISNVDKDALQSKLDEDDINHLWELDGAKYIAIENCDLQGFATLEDICFDHQTDENYILGKLLCYGHTFGYTVDYSAECTMDDDNDTKCWNCSCFVLPNGCLKGEKSDAEN